MGVKGLGRGEGGNQLKKGKGSRTRESLFRLWG